jgi:hypothetical protein
VPFPIPKDGYEVMWNHLVRYQGRANDSNFYNSMVDASGRYILSANGVMKEEFPYYDEDKTAFASGIFFKLKIVYANPPRKNGEALLIMDYIDMTEKPRIVYQYLPGQRRTKLAPEIAFDTPDPSAGGTETCDDNYLFNGSMERFNFKLIGKREVFIPYNTYKATYQTNREDLFGPKHLNPDVIRWELHRVWVVEATIKPGKRHIYHKQRYYFDEDSWIAQATEKYDAHGNLFKVGFAHQAPSYDEPAPSAGLVASHNLFAGTYVVLTWPGPSGYFRPVKPTPDREWTPQAISGGGIR